MELLIAIGLFAWLSVCVVVVALCVAASRGDDALVLAGSAEPTDTPLRLVA